MNILLGVIADDFIGATDLASILVQGGMRAIQVIDVPKVDLPLEDVKVRVILK